MMITAMNQLDIRATILRIHNDHGISCPADAENALVRSLEDLQRDGQLTKAGVQKTAGQMSSQFYKNNGLVSAAQYGRLLWDGLSVSIPAKAAQSTTMTETHF